jgi:hypothetical protein
MGMLAKPMQDIILEYVPLCQSGGENAPEGTGAVDDAQEPVRLETVVVAFDEEAGRGDLLS